MREGAATSSEGTPCWRGARREFMMTLTSARAEREGGRGKERGRGREAPGLCVGGGMEDGGVQGRGGGLEGMCVCEEE